MDLRDLVLALRRYDTLTARQQVADAIRNSVRWTDVSMPVDMDAEGLAIAAAVAELLASRAGQSPPSWTAAVPPAPHPVYLVRAAATMPRVRRTCELESPEPLRRRGILALPDFLTSA